MQWIYIICFALISAGLLALFGVQPRDFIDALFRSQRKAANVKITKGQIRIKNTDLPFILARLMPSDFKQKL